jgi:N-sulfoglucosamine sulfohydrolase
VDAGSGQRDYYEGMKLSRRDFLGSAALVATAQTAGSRPNILYIIQEDIGPHHACDGEPLVRTPHVDKLAAQGVRFSNMFCTGPVCSASRSALMTGRYQNNIGAHNHRTWEWHKPTLAAPVRHISDWFRDAGYYTCNIQPLKQKGGGPNGAAGSGKVDLNFHHEGANPAGFFDGKDWTERKPGQPFFAHITIMETHKGPGWKIARRLPKEELVDPAKLKLAAFYPDNPIVRDENANYLDAIHLSDGYVGELLGRLEREGLAKNTVVVLSSDHGPLFRGKQFLYDGGMRIPLIVKFPDGRSAGKVNNDLVSAIDLAPTMLGFAGIKPPAGAMQGQDVFGTAYKPRPHVFAARDRMDTSIDRMRAVRTDRYKYIRNYFPGTPYMQTNDYKEKSYPTWNLVKDLGREGKLNKAQTLFSALEKPIEELYDLKADPDEVHNLALDQAHKQTVKQLRALVDGFVAENDKLVRFEDPVDIFRGYNRRLPEDAA